MKTFYVSFIALLLVFSTGSAFAQGIYMELTPASGSTPVELQVGIQVSSVQNLIENEATIGSATSGAGGGKVAFKAFTVTKQVDASSFWIQRNLAAGAHYKRARFNFKNAAGETVYQISLGTVFTTNYATSAAEVCPSGCVGIAETITFAYGEIAVTDFKQTPPRFFEWNQLYNIGRVDSFLKEQ